MSHLAIASKAEPNLTPLLDVVLQLLMFFILVTRFVTVQQNPEENENQEALLLPVAQSARPIDKVDGDPLFLNMDLKKTRDGDIVQVIVWGERKGLDQVRQWLIDQYDLARRAGQPKTTVILRAHRDIKYKVIKQVLNYCQEAGFKDVRVRAEAKLG
jgi:biopolymer transport protein ExbD